MNHGSGIHGPRQDDALEREVRSPGPGQLQVRSDLARHLDQATFPANRQHLLDTLAGHHAPQQLIDLVAGLPGDRYSGLADVIRALGLPLETRNAAR